MKAKLDETRRKEWDNWEGYSNLRKISRKDFEDMRRAIPL